MAFTGSIQNRRPGAGVYPGAGVARGGQQGRMGAITNGVGGARQGGATARASQPRRQTTGGIGTVPQGTPPPVPARTPRGRTFTDGRGNLRAIGGRIIRAAPPLRTPSPDLMTTPQPGAPPIPPEPLDQPPAYTPQFELHDSEYFMGLADEQASLDQALNPMQSELAKLRTPMGGKTLFDSMFERANTDFLETVRGSRVGAAQSGLLRSGAYNRQAAGLGSDWVRQQDELSNQYGAGRINALETQSAQARAAFAQRQRALEMAAAARARDRLAAANAAIYGQTIMPEGG